MASIGEERGARDSWTCVAPGGPDTIARGQADGEDRKRDFTRDPQARAPHAAPLMSPSRPLARIQTSDFRKSFQRIPGLSKKLFTGSQTTGPAVDKKKRRILKRERNQSSAAGRYAPGTRSTHHHVDDEEWKEEGASHDEKPAEAR